MATNVDAQICVRRDTAANWASSNPTLLNGEVGYDTTNNKLKIGNGSSTWTALSYLTDATGGAGWPDAMTKILWATDFLVNAVDYASTSIYGSTEYNWNGTAGSADFGTDATNFASHAGVMTGIVLANNVVLNAGQSQPEGWSGSTPPRMASLASGTHESLFIVQAGGGFFLSTPSNRYTLYYGFWSVNASGTRPDQSGAFGAFFRYSDNINGGKWQCVVRVNNGSGTAVEYTWDSLLLVSMDWAVLKVEVNPGTIAAPDPTIKFYTNGNLVATVDLNTDVGASGFLPDVSYFTQACLRGNTISTGGVYKIDYMHYYATFTAKFSVPSSYSED